MEFSNADVLPLDVMEVIGYLNERVSELEKAEGNPFALQELSDSLTRILEFRKQLEDFSRKAAKAKNKRDTARLNDFLISASRRANRAIGLVTGVHEARYLARLELIQEYVAINSALLTLEKMPFTKIHPRTLARLREYDDVPNKLVDVVDAIMNLRSECNRLASLIREEIATLLSNLRVTQNDLEKLLT
jgi:hypothetical protein